jgi:F0F1-type ATP synthase gamma subunit
LTIEYNKARQAMITQELTEIVGGSMSINKWLLWIKLKK